MSDRTDDDSSESENEFLVSRSEVNLESSFFGSQGKKPVVTLRKTDTYENSDDSDEFSNINDSKSVELFSQVLKNLEDTQAICSRNENAEREETANVASTAKKKEAKGIRNETETNHLSQHVHDLLFEGEGKTFELSDVKENDSEDENLDDAAGPTNYTTPREGVRITLPGTGLMLKKKKNRPSLNKIIENRINQELRANQLLIHKVGILCWLAHGFHLNKVINNAEVLGMALSLIPQGNCPNGRSDLTYIEQFVKWFRKKFTVKKTDREERITEETLLKRFQQQEVLNYKEFVLLCIAVLRAIGMNCRLIISLCPPPLKIQQSQLFKANLKREKDKSDKSVKKEEKNKKENVPNKSTKKRKKGEEEETTSTENKIIPENSEISRKNAQLAARKKAALILTGKSKENKNEEAKADQQEASSSKKSKTQNSANKNETISKNMTRQLRTRSRIKSSSDDSSVTVPNKVDEASVHLSKSSRRKKPVKTDYVEVMNEDSETDENFQPKKKRHTSKNEETAKSSSKKKETNRLLSSDDETNYLNGNKNSQDFWLEVYLESEENWISVDIMNEKVHCVTELYKNASKPVLYVIAWNFDGEIKDVTRRYCPRWLTETRKQRINEDWFIDTIRHRKEKDTPLSRAEDKLLAQKELEQPLPKTVGECKGHPLYVIVRHLLKYEALYPPDCVPLGYLQNKEAIYSRHCVHTLSTRETWIKKARVVKPNEEAYKIVKAMPKYDKLSGSKIVDRTVELFGKWQTTDYVPPEAKDGIVPRNEYGNVDLFKESMLPKGTVYIDLPGLNRIARKLNIDCAHAVVGFKFGCMGAVADYRGFVVCSEYEDVLREAWEFEQAEAVKRAREKRYKRIYGNWKRLIDGLRIKEKLAGKYEFESKEKSTLTNKRSKQKTSDAKRSKII